MTNDRKVEKGIANVIRTFRTLHHADSNLTITITVSIKYQLSSFHSLVPRLSTHRKPGYEAILFILLYGLNAGPPA